MNINKTTVLIFCILLSACTEQNSLKEGFPQDLCRYTKTQNFRNSQIQAGCAMYSIDSKGNSTGVCVLPIFSTITQQEIKIDCSKTYWASK